MGSEFSRGPAPGRRLAARRLMSRIALCALIALSAAAEGNPPSAQGWDALYDSRLASTAAVLEARLALRGAELDLARFREPWKPTIAISASSANPLGIGSNGFSGSIVPSVTLENVLGADLALKAPLTAASGALQPGDPSLTLTRKLFVEGEADRLDAEAALLNARASLRNAEGAVRLALATEILNAVYYTSLLEANEANLAVLERVRRATVDSFSLREVERRVLGARKSILSAKSALGALDPKVMERRDALYADVLRLQAEWTAQAAAAEASDAPPPDTLAAKALEKSLAAAEKRGAFAVLPWLPNPSLGASVAWDVSEGALDWGLSLSIAYTALDPGRTALNAERRRTLPRIYAGRLDDARKGIADSVRRIRSAIAALELDRKIKEFDIADAEDEFKTYDALYRGGYSTEENMVIAQIDVSVERLAARKIDHDILIQILNLAQYYGADAAAP